MALRPSRLRTAPTAAALCLAAAVAGWWAVAAVGGVLPWVAAILATAALVFGVVSWLAVGLVFWILLRRKKSPRPPVIGAP